jgi:hypothetical protein
MRQPVFATGINCIDCRTQHPVAEGMKRHLNVHPESQIKFLDQTQ